MKKIVAILMFIFGVITLNAQTDLKGVFKEIDVARHDDVLDVFLGDNKELKEQTIDTVLKKTNYYNPSVIFSLSRELFNQGKKDEATFWFYVAQLRARYDANLCMDDSVKDALVLLDDSCPDIIQYAFQDIDNLEKIVLRAIDFVRTNEENYDHRWINLLGLDVIMDGLDNDSKKKELSQPQKKWASIKKKTIDDYYNGFIEYIKNKKK